MSLCYLAYGSNMSLAQMRMRCPESAAIGIGWLAGHALCFPRYSTRRRSGAASIRPQPGATVWGVIYATTDADLARLDVFEGCRADRPAADNAYNRATVQVARKDLEPLTCVTYVARPESDHIPPSLDYLQIILTGAIENGLPDHYVQALQSIEPARS